MRVGTALRNYGGQPFALPVPTIDGKIEDTKVWGLGIGFGYAITEQFAIQAAGGFDHLSNDGWGYFDGNDSYTRWAIWVSASYKLTSNLTIQPEIGYFNYGDAVGYGNAINEVDGGSEWLVGHCPYSLLFFLLAGFGVNFYNLAFREAKITFFASRGSLPRENF
jgi:hypothetical protein